MSKPSHPHSPPQPLEQLVDPYGRRLHYLRLSITDRCNLRCTYCMPSQGVAKLAHDQVLTLEELVRVARAAVSLGVDKIRLTGGEPLLRRGLGVLLKALDRLRPRPDLRITTNGHFLAQHLPLLLQSGVSTLNVSLDTLDPEQYGEISGLGAQAGPRAFRRVWRGIQAALESGQVAVKINVVLLAGVNHDQARDFARLTRRLPLAVRFIEYMPVGRHQPFQARRFISGRQVLEELGQLGRLEPLPHRAGDGPARRYRLEGAMGELGVISAVSSHFCAQCNRLRVSAEGRLVPCLLSEVSLDLKPLLRAGCSERELKQALLRAARAKPRHHDQALDNLHGAGCSMSRLGG